MLGGDILIIDVSRLKSGIIEYIDIDEKVEALGTDYNFYEDADAIYYRGYLIRKKPFSPSLIFYYVDSDAETVYVIRILRHETNWQEILKEALFYTFD